MFAGQQGSRNKYGVFELWEYSKSERKESDEAEDETRGMNNPRGHGGNGGYRGNGGNDRYYGVKRGRYD